MTTVSRRAVVKVLELDETPDGRIVIDLDLVLPDGSPAKVQVRGDLYVPVIGDLGGAPSLLLEIVPRAKPPSGPWATPPVRKERRADGEK